MVSDLPSTTHHAWSFARRALVVCALAAVIGFSTVGSGHNIEAVPAQHDSVLQSALPVMHEVISDSGMELLHDVTDTHNGARPSMMLPQVVSPVHPKYRTLEMEVTAYCACPKCCGPNAQGLTASGKLVSYNNGEFVAADTSVLPFGTKLIIPGYASSTPVEVIDRGGAIKGNKLDVFYASHEEALKWGRQKISVTILN